MLIKQVSVALPNSQNTGWGLAGRRITEELKKSSLVSDLNGTGILERPFPTTLQGNFLQGVEGVTCMPQYPRVDVVESGKHVGYAFIEQNLLMREYAENLLRQFDAVIAGSTWAYEQMNEAVGDRFEVALAIQGVDQDIFHSISLAGEAAKDPAWFTVLSAGKWEYRKGQDVVIAAMKVMMDRHDDVRLIGSWWNPWPGSAKTMEQSKVVKYRYNESKEALMPGASIVECAIVGAMLDPGRVEFLRQTTHLAMPSVYRRADVAIFPNRCEAGTNLPLMEAASCGVPIIATVQHGHADVESAIHFELKRSSLATIHEGGMATAEWWEPELEEVIDALETAYQVWQCGQLSVHGIAARRAIEPFTWKGCAESILEVF